MGHCCSRRCTGQKASRLSHSLQTRHSGEEEKLGPLIASEVLETPRKRGLGSNAVSRAEPFDRSHPLREPERPAGNIQTDPCILTDVPLRTATKLTACRKNWDRSIRLGQPDLRSGVASCHSVDRNGFLSRSIATAPTKKAPPTIIKELSSDCS